MLLGETVMSPPTTATEICCCMTCVGAAAGTAEDSGIASMWTAGSGVVLGERAGASTAARGFGWGPAPLAEVAKLAMATVMAADVATAARARLTKPLFVRMSHARAERLQSRPRAACHLHRSGRPRGVRAVGIQ